MKYDIKNWDCKIHANVNYGGCQKFWYIFTKNVDGVYFVYKNVLWVFIRIYFINTHVDN